MDDLDALQRKIDQAKAHAGLDADEESQNAARNQAGRAMNMATDFVVAAGVGCALGYFIDRWLGTSPVFLISFFFVGFGAGVRNLLRAQKELES